MTQKTDRELLELAAKAAGVTYVGYDPLGGLQVFYTKEQRSCGNESWYWNPLTDDGDSLRLAVKLGRTDLFLLVGKLALADECKGLTGVAVVRRAIVWDIAAAEIGEQQ